MSTVSFWSTAPTSSMDTTPGNLVIGTKFRCNTAGNVTALRYYEQSATAGTVTLRLLNSSSTALATVTHTAVNGQSGWREVTLGTPVALSAGSDYMVTSYIPSPMNYAYGTINTLPLSSARSTSGTELSTVVDGNRTVCGSTGNGVYAYNATTSTVPDQTFSSSNYGVDVVFDTGGGSGETPVDVSAFASTQTAVSGTWTTPENMTGTNDALFGYCTIASSGGTASRDVGGFDFSAIPDAATLNTVNVTVWHYVANATRMNPSQAQFFHDGAAVGSVVTLTESTTTTTNDTFAVTGLTIADLKSGLCAVRLTGRHATGSTTSSTARFDAVQIAVNYTPPPAATAKSGTDTGSSSESASILSVTLSSADTRPSATEAAALAVTLSTGDTATAIEAATASQSMAVSGPDTGQSAEQASLLATASGAQTAGSTEGQTLTATMAGADSRPAATEAVTLTVTLATGDTAHAVEGQTAQDLGNVTTGADTRPAATEGQSLVAQVTPQESASGATQTASVAAQVGSVQPTSASEQASLLASVPSQPESAGHTEAATLVVSVTAADIAACAEAVSLLASLSSAQTAHGLDEAMTESGGEKQVVEGATGLESGSVARTSSTGESRPVADTASLLATPPSQSQAGVSFDSAVLSVAITQVDLGHSAEGTSLKASMVADEPVEYAEQALLVAVLTASDLAAAAEATTLITGGARNWHGISATSSADGVMTVNVQLSGGREATIRIKRLEG